MINTSAPIMKTNMGEEVLDLVIPYIHNVEDRSSVSLVSRKFYEIDGITRKCVTVQAYYCPNPVSLSKRFPFIESLTLKGPPPIFYNRDGYIIRITPWIQQFALEFRSLKELHIRNLVVLDEDLETLGRTRGKDLRSLKISESEGYSSDGLRHVSKYCNQLRTLCLGSSHDIEVNAGIWLHELALNSTVLEMFKFRSTDISNSEDLTLLAKNCCNSLKSLKIGECYLSELGDAFRYAVRLEHFGGDIWDEESDLVGFQFPPNTCSLSIQDLPVTRCSTVLPFLNHIKKLKLACLELDAECQCLLFKRCPNLEVLSTEDVCGDGGLQVIGKFCKKLRKLTHHGRVTHVGLISLAKGCTNLESLDVVIKNISNEALECVGTHLKNLRNFRIGARKENSIRDLPLDNGIQAMLMGCSKLERLCIRHLWHGGLTDVGLEYIGKYGSNLRSLALECVENSNTGLVKLSDAGLVKLSEGCPKLRKLELTNCRFSKQVVTSFVNNIPSLRYVGNSDRTDLYWIGTHSSRI
ncbi:leucine-rich repeat, cysteine-containing subtype protein [Tanacetum coccineum]